MILTTNIATLLITIGVGIVLPWLVALITKESLPPQVKAAILLLLSIAAGVIGGLVSTPPTTWAQWQQVLLTVFVTFVAAFSSEYMSDRTNLTPGINHATAKFGIGAPAPKADPPAV
jgi:hypothetical protein